ncbi:MAG: tripartite tricarboxylate transporter TctB family protein [Candidatus Methanosuratincola sp.]
MSIRTRIESSVVGAIGLGSILQGAWLVLWKDPHVLYDPLGPGSYAIVVGIGLTVCGFLLLLYGETSSNELGRSSPGRLRMVVLLASSVGYLLILPALGYFISTVLFFVFALRSQGTKSWSRLWLLSVILSVLLYVVFVRLCNMVLPKDALLGLLMEWLTIWIS